MLGIVGGGPADDEDAGSAGMGIAGAAGLAGDDDNEDDDEDDDDEEEEEDDDAYEDAEPADDEEKAPLERRRGGGVGVAVAVAAGRARAKRRAASHTWGFPLVVSLALLVFGSGVILGGGAGRMQMRGWSSGKKRGDETLWWRLTTTESYLRR